ncbi:MAG: flagellar biosynthesis protein FlhB [Gammaproteobacteria bacterium]|nr:flagellar biosynthesis protein FlhB [Gammaproteobacteria bacterium]MBI5615847.1 flagellar biosynthesis protein FlhB [Gammaproteobacteria bacterium]
MAAETESGEERSEQATAKRLQEARDKGDIARSRELASMLLMIGGGIAIYQLGGQLNRGLVGLMRHYFVFDRVTVGETVELHLAFTKAIVATLVDLAPLLGALAALSLIGPLALGGWLFNLGSCAFKFERLDPIAGLGRVFGIHGLVEVVKAVAKFAIVVVCAVIAMKIEYRQVVALGDSALEPGLAATAAICFKSFMIVGGGLVIVTLFDVPYQLWEHARKLRMTRQELKDELRESEGSPELRGRIRQMQQELSNRRMMEKVPKADVVITNPEHYAVALRFDPETMSAPVVVAKGADRVALRIREIAKENRVPMLEAPPLARSLYHTTKLDKEIPSGLYLAVAQVLAYVFQLKRAARDGLRPMPPANLPIPSELRYD